jgi:hypothetical protein
MIPFASVLLMGGPNVGFVGMTSRSGAGTIVWPAGTSVGDYAVILVAYNGGTTLSGYSLSSISTGTTYLNTHHKPLVLADISAPPTIAAALDTVHVLVYRGVTTLTKKSETTSGTTDTTLNLTGFTKNVACKAILNVVIDRAGVGIGPGSPPAYLTSRASNVVGAYFAVRAADTLNPGAYTSTATFAWTGFDSASSYAQVGASFEFT